MKFAVAILSFNHPHITSRCVRSCLKLVGPNQLYLFHHGTLEKHKEFLKQECPNVNHLESDWNKGFSGGANYLLDYLFETFEWLYFLTNDTECLSLGAIPQEPGLYAPLIWRRKTGIIDSLGGGFYPAEEKIFHLKQEEDWLGDYFKYVPGTAFLMHKSIWNQVHHFDESLHTYWEDVDFSMRVQKKGLKLTYLKSFELLHAVGKTCHKDPFYTNELFKRNRTIVSKRWM
jgi:GT2 family glycosyltransferase